MRLGRRRCGSPTIQSDNVHVNEPFPSWTWTPDAVENAEAVAQVEDDLPCYREGLVHPHAILSLANRAFTRRYHLPAWLHVGSGVRMRQPRAGEGPDGRAAARPRPELALIGVTKIALFGSVARGDDREDSDIAVSTVNPRDFQLRASVRRLVEVHCNRGVDVLPLPLRYPLSEVAGEDLLEVA